MAAEPHLVEDELKKLSISEEPASDDEGDTEEIAKRTFHFVVQNDTDLPVAMACWPVRASKHSDFILSTFRGADFHGSVPPSTMVSSEHTFHVGNMRGPKRYSPLKRWGWVYFDLVRADGIKVHLQAFLKVNRKEVVTALLGRTDLDSNVEGPMPSGELGSVKVDGHTVTFILDNSVKEAQNVVDDTMKKGSHIVPGKGIQTTSYVSYALGRTSLLVQDEARYHEFEAPSEGKRLNAMRTSVHKVEGLKSRTIAAFVERQGQGWFEGHVKVEPVTGIARGKNFDSTATSTVIFCDDGVINRGFHDAGLGRHDQLYVYVTPLRDSWLGNLIAENSAWNDVPFSKLALAGAHDSGMYGPLHAGLALLIQQGHLGNALKNHVAASIAQPVVRIVVQALEMVKLKPERVINNIALTQKDTFPDQLKMGVRFFDFRPGYCFSDVIYGKKESIHHIHAIVPGCDYVEFLTEVFTFLGDHPSEIVFVELKSDGFAVREDKKDDKGVVQVCSMIPTVEELQRCIDKAKEATTEKGREIQVGSAVDLDRKIGEIIAEKKRLILVDRVHEPEAWIRADSYDHVSYNTFEAATIIHSLEKTFAEFSKSGAILDGKPSKGTIYQLQATPTASIKDDVGASFTYSDSSSLLTGMKPVMDAATYPWLSGKKFEDPGNVILLNDFVEGVLVEHAVEISRQRAGL